MATDELRKTIRIQFFVTNQMDQDILEASEAQGMTTAEWLRDVVRDVLNQRSTERTDGAA